MIKLDATTKSLEVVLTGAPATTQPTWTVHYVDVDATQAISAASEADGATNSSTSVSMVAAPASGHVRKIDYLTVFNEDTAAVTVKVQINNNGTKRTLQRTTLQPNETLQYVSK